MNEAVDSTGSFQHGQASVLLWPAALATVAVGGLYTALPPSLFPGPHWLLISVVATLLLLTIGAHRAGRHDLEQLLGFVLSGVITAAMIASLILLIRALPSKTEEPLVLLRSAAALWATNILVFALWYWRLDAGGPHQRLGRDHMRGAFLFPQLTLTPDDRIQLDCEDWTPGFMDYLFLAFNTSTALSPADVPILSPWAKGLMMTQATISLTVLALLAARAVNIM